MCRVCFIHHSPTHSHTGHVCSVFTMLPAPPSRYGPIDSIWSKHNRRKKSAGNNKNTKGQRRRRSEEEEGESRAEEEGTKTIETCKVEVRRRNEKPYERKRRRMTKNG